jgi:transcription initiation factor TFIID subunit TAF12
MLPTCAWCAAVHAAGGDGGLFGGLKQAFGSPGKQQQPQQQQQQQQQTPKQQQQQQQQQAPARAAGTVAAPEFPPYQVFRKGAAYDLR